MDHAVTKTTCAISSQPISPILPSCADDQALHCNPALKGGLTTPAQSSMQPVLQHPPSRLCLCICICTCICICLYIYVNIDVHVYAYVFLCIYVFTYLYICLYARMLCSVGWENQDKLLRKARSSKGMWARVNTFLENAVHNSTVILLYYETLSQLLLLVDLGRGPRAQRGPAKKHCLFGHIVCICM